MLEGVRLCLGWDCGVRPGASAGGLSTPGGGGGCCLGRDNTLEQAVTMARMDSPTS